MSVLRRPPKSLLLLFAMVLCWVSVLTLFAQSEPEPFLTSEPVASEYLPLAEPGVAYRAISIEVSPADEVMVDVNAAPPIVLEENIPASNDDSIVTSVAAIEKEEEASARTQIQESAVAAKQEDKPRLKEADTAQLMQVTDKSTNETAEKAEKAQDSLEAQDSEEKPKELYYFETSRGTTLAMILILLSFVSYYTFQAQRGKEMFIRRISGLSAIEDAVGRATEMGRGVLYVPGIADMDDIQTIASVTIMGHVSRKTAEYDTDLYAPMCRSFVMSVAHEVVKQAYMEKGRVDAYRADRINYLTDDQFGYVAGVGGVMMRDKPAACFYLGTFYAESLILAETGNSIGAIQIAGTAEPSQIPFFVASCDYTLIGEELFAASAYLSRNPREIGSLKGQDMVKMVIIAAIILGTLLVTIANTEYGRSSYFATFATTFMEFLK